MTTKTIHYSDTLLKHGEDLANLAEKIVAVIDGETPSNPKVVKVDTEEVLLYIKGQARQSCKIYLFPASLSTASAYLVEELIMAAGDKFEAVITSDSYMGDFMILRVSYKVILD